MSAMFAPTSVLSQMFITKIKEGCSFCAFAGFTLVYMYHKFFNSITAAIDFVFQVCHCFSPSMNPRLGVVLSDVKTKAA